MKDKKCIMILYCRALEDDVTIGNYVVDMYAKLGSVLEAQSGLNK